MGALRYASSASYNPYKKITNQNEQRKAILSHHKIADTYNNAERLTTKQLKEYSKAHRAIEKEVIDLYAKHSIDGALSRTELFNLNMLEDKMKQVKEIITELAQSELDYSNKLYPSIYTEVLSGTANIYGVKINQINTKTIDAILKYPWSGTTYDDRIKRNATKYMQNVRDVITRGAVRGSSIKTMTQDLVNTSNLSMRTARTLIRTESMFYANIGQLVGYSLAGYTEVRHIVAIDERTCSECMESEGQIYPIEDAFSILPVHPNCRCTWAPVVDSINLDAAIKHYEDILLKKYGLVN